MRTGCFHESEEKKQTNPGLHRIQFMGGPTDRGWCWAARRLSGSLKLGSAVGAYKLIRKKMYLHVRMHVSQANSKVRHTPGRIWLLIMLMVLSL
jgi:hypothetical protein